MKEEKGHKDHRIKGQWLPTTRKEMEHLGWEQADVILFTGDAYIPGSKVVTNLPGSDKHAAASSLTRLIALVPTKTLHPGHFV